MSKKNPPTPAAMLADLQRMVCEDGTTDAIRVQALALAFEIGKNQGHLDGAISMADRLTASAKSRLESPQ